MGELDLHYTTILGSNGVSIIVIKGLACVLNDEGNLNKNDNLWRKFCINFCRS